MYHSCEKCLICRLAMLGKSNSNLPYSIALLEKNHSHGTVDVIGHSRLCQVHQQPTAGFVESGND